MRVCTVLLVACLSGLAGTVAGLPFDEGNLIQKDSKLRVADVEEQLATDNGHSMSELPSALAQIPGMEDMMGNMSMPDLMAMATKVLGTLRDKTFVEALQTTLREVLTAAMDMTEASGARVVELKVAGENLTSDEDVYQLLLGFFRKEEKAVIELAHLVERKVKKLMTVMPNISIDIPGLKKVTSPDAIGDLLQEQLGGLYSEILTCSNTTLCSTMAPLIENMTIADTAMGEQVLPMISQAEGMIPSMGPMIGMIAPDVVDTVVALANSTLGLVGPVLTSFKTAIHSEINEVTKLAKVNAHCTQFSGSERSSPSAFLFAAVLATYAAFRV